VANLGISYSSRGRQQYQRLTPDLSGGIFPEMSLGKNLGRLNNALAIAPEMLD
jgi:hypothetical protein